jgi:predicted RNA-binding Zn ribbon-like protein
MTQPPRKLTFDLIAGRLCLDFANTLDHRLSGNPEEKLNGYAQLVEFGRQTGVFSPSEARKLQHEGRKNKGEASRLFQHAVAVREMMFRILSAAAARREISKADAAALNAELRRLNTGSLIAPGNGGSAWRWVEKSSGAEKLIGRVVRSAMELLTSEDIERVKECPAETCGWLFMDGSRSRNRRWCEMRTCGSQHKARAYYQRKKAGRTRGRASAKPA